MISMHRAIGFFAGCFYILYTKCLIKTVVHVKLLLLHNANTINIICSLKLL